MIFGISASKSMKRSVFRSIRGVTKNFEHFQNDFAQKRPDGPLTCDDFLESAHRDLSNGRVFRSIRSVTTTLENFESKFTQKRLDGSLEYCSFWNQRFEIFE